jgi:hypothetical protein
LGHDRQEETNAGSGKKAAFPGCEMLPTLSFDCFGLAPRAACFDGNLHSTFHRIFEGHFDSEQAVLVGRFGFCQVSPARVKPVLKHIRRAETGSAAVLEIKG